MQAIQLKSFWGKRLSDAFFYILPDYCLRRILGLPQEIHLSFPRLNIVGFFYCLFWRIFSRAGLEPLTQMMAPIVILWSGGWTCEQINHRTAKMATTPRAMVTQGQRLSLHRMSGQGVWSLMVKRLARKTPKHPLKIVNHLVVLLYYKTKKMGGVCPDDKGMV